MCRLGHEKAPNGRVRYHLNGVPGVSWQGMKFRVFYCSVQRNLLKARLWRSIGGDLRGLGRKEGRENWEWRLSKPSMVYDRVSYSPLVEGVWGSPAPVTCAFMDWYLATDHLIKRNFNTLRGCNTSNNNQALVPKFLGSAKDP